MMNAYWSEVLRVIEKVLSGCHGINCVYLRILVEWVLKNCDISILRCLERWLGNLLMTLNLL